MRRGRTRRSLHAKLGIQEPPLPRLQSGGMTVGEGVVVGFGWGVGEGLEGGSSAGWWLSPDGSDSLSRGDHCHMPVCPRR